MRRTWLLWLTILFLTGCSGGGAHPPEASAVTSNRQAAAGKLTSYTADLKGTVSFGGDNRTVTGREWAQAPDLFRMELTVDGRRLVTVSDGKTVYRYAQGTNRVMERPVAAGQGAGGRPLPLIGAVVERTLADYNITLAGSDNMAGRPAYVLDLQPKPGAGTAAVSAMKLWVDAQLWLPVKETFTVRGNPSSFEFDNLRVDPAIPSGEFQFKVPPGASIETASAKPQVTLSEAPAVAGGPADGVITAGAADPNGEVILVGQQ